MEIYETIATRRNCPHPNWTRNGLPKPVPNWWCPSPPRLSLAMLNRPNWWWDKQLNQDSKWLSQMCKRTQCTSEGLSRWKSLCRVPPQCTMDLRITLRPCFMLNQHLFGTKVNRQTPLNWMLLHPQKSGPQCKWRWKNLLMTSGWSLCYVGFQQHSHLHYYSNVSFNIGWGVIRIVIFVGIAGMTCQTWCRVSLKSDTGQYLRGVH